MEENNDKLKIKLKSRIQGRVVHESQSGPNANKPNYDFDNSFKN